MSQYPILEDGSDGEDVLKLQRLLNALGYELEEDGVFGANTEDAVMDFQEEQGLDTDGIVGPNTWKALVRVVDAHD